MRPQTSHVAGTLGYMAPELARTGKANTSTDVYAFGTFMLEVACGRRPIEARASPDQTFLADWITDCWDNGDIVAAIDGRLEKRFVLQEAELGLLCSHPVAAARPTMSSVISYLDGVAALPENLNSMENPNDELITERNYTVPPLRITESFVSHGR
ncbi:L-type lectin receptor kinase V.2 [Hibiscus trionum]|uniref:L-type lectin receptor kinase V.2 n=1 Tax=Hibiscus trionum TaxID=183268 RepID=A0A9W7LIM9_HIBTR|nr:L-type lectin receptor kinase V.2 [Hibiscus trionum]